MGEGLCVKTCTPRRDTKGRAFSGKPQQQHNRQAWAPAKRLQAICCTITMCGSHIAKGPTMMLRRVFLVSSESAVWAYFSACLMSYIVLGVLCFITAEKWRMSLIYSSWARQWQGPCSSYPQGRSSCDISLFTKMYLLLRTILTNFSIAMHAQCRWTRPVGQMFVSSDDVFGAYMLQCRTISGFFDCISCRCHACCQGLL